MKELYFCFKKAKYFLWFDPEFCSYDEDDPIFIISDKREFVRDSDIVDQAEKIFVETGATKIMENYFRIPRPFIEEFFDILERAGFTVIYSSQLV